MPYNWDKPFIVRDARNGDWFWVERYVWRDERLTSSDKVVYGTLAYFANGKDQQAYPSLHKIADEGRLSRAQVAVSLKKLRELGYIRVVYTKGKVNKYQLLKNKPVQNLDQSKINHDQSRIELRVVQNKATNNNYIERITNNRKFIEKKDKKGNILYEEI